jgi:phytoene synthase
MEPAPTIIDPERALTLVYAPTPVRPALAALWRLDERLGSVVATTTEPMIGAIRLAWWREALEALDRGSPPDEPLLREIAGTLLPLGISGAELAAIEAGWAALLEDDPPDGEAIERHGKLRGRLLFGLAARALGQGDSEEAAIAGEGWALIDLGSRIRDPQAAALARKRARECLSSLSGYRWPRALRALGALAVLARHDACAAGPRRQASPRRIGRVLLHRFTGR